MQSTPITLPISMDHRLRWLASAVLFTFIGLLGMTLSSPMAAAQATAPRPAPDTAPSAGESYPQFAAAKATPTMSLKDVRIGMKGYGLTVFHGTKIEPFPIEVISVAYTAGMDQTSSPNRGIIWIRSKEPRMVESGPVQGMSGSPIYLWPKGEEHQLGEGGKLIGAFAFGFSYPKQCIVGVQPIEYMQEVGQHALQQEKLPAQQKSLQRRHQRHPARLGPTLADRRPRITGSRPQGAARSAAGTGGPQPTAARPVNVKSKANKVEQVKTAAPRH